MDFDFIIVGQGLAGSLLANALLKSGKKTLIIDEDKTISSSKIAAGIVHPVTGRRIVKTWKADVLIPFAKGAYDEIGTMLNEKLFYDLPHIEVFTSVKNRNDWVARSGEDGYQKYIGEEIQQNVLNLYFNSDFGGISIYQSGFLKINAFLDAFKKYFQSKNILTTDSFSFEDLSLEKEFVLWKNISASKIIFCEGANAVNNPFFKHLPFLPAKGELLEIYSEELSQDYIINHGMFILPTGNHCFKVGSTYEWNFKNIEPSTEGKSQLESFLKKFLKVNYEITGHYAAIRPTVQDRRPIVGLHPEYSSLGIFNGLGTKGVMLAPYYAKQFADFLTKDSEIDDEVNLKRFSV